MLFCRCGCVTKPCSLCLASLLATKLKSQFYNRVSEVTLGSFLVFFCYVWGHKAMQLVLGRLAFRHEKRWCIAVADASHKAMQLVFGRLAGHKTEMSILL